MMIYSANYVLEEHLMTWKNVDNSKSRLQNNIQKNISIEKDGKAINQNISFASP